jgi:hypothetical protein
VHIVPDCVCDTVCVIRRQTYIGISRQTHIRIQRSGCARRQCMCVHVDSVYDTSSTLSTCTSCEGYTHTQYVISVCDTRTHTDCVNDTHN